MALSNEERSRRESGIIRLRNDGYSNSEVAQELGLSLPVVLWTVRQMIREERLKPLKRGARQSKTDERAAKVIKMVQERATLEAIGKSLGGVSIERARQIVNTIRSTYGDRVFETDDPWLLDREVADQLGVETQVIRQICAEGTIPHQRRNHSRSCGCLIRKSTLPQLQVHPLIKRVCVICGQLLDSNCRNTKFCSEECAKARNYNLHAAYRENGAKRPNLKGWRGLLKRRLQDHLVFESESWVTISEAANISGLTTTQIKVLERNGFLTIHSDPKRIAKRTGKPMILYAASEMDIARQVLKEAAKKA